MNKYIGIIISLIAGLSTLLGYFSIYIKGDKNKIISSFLAFSSGVMITLSIMDLIPSSYVYIRNEGLLRTFVLILIFISLGTILSYLIDITNSKKEELYKTGFISMLGIVIHNIPEGIATYVLSTIDINLGIIFSVAIIMHNIPEGIGISIPIYYSTKSKSKTFLYVLIAGLSEPFGAIISKIFLSKYINTLIMGYLYAFIAGLMIYIAYFELYKTSLKYSKKNINYLLVGSLFILIVEILLKL